MFGLSVVQLAVFVVVVLCAGVSWLRRRSAEPYLTGEERVEVKRSELRSSRGYLRSQQLLLGVAGLALVAFGEFAWGVALLIFTAALTLISERSMKQKLDGLDAPSG